MTHPLDYNRLLEVLVIQGRREEGEEIDEYARRLWHHYVYDDAYSDIAPLNPGPIRLTPRPANPAPAPDGT